MTVHHLDEVIEAREIREAEAERLQKAATENVRTCEAIWTFLGIEALCGDPAIGLFRRACVHEHVRDGWMCAGHAGTPQNGLCRTCYELPGDASHECPIGIAEVTA